MVELIVWFASVAPDARGSVLVELETDVGVSQPGMVVVGPPDAAVREREERVVGASYALAALPSEPEHRRMPRRPVVLSEVLAAPSGPETRAATSLRRPATNGGEAARSQGGAVGVHG
ncbi:MAG: hypothetical protein AVDCRST_MAG59-852 [uncultured Thermomicrobiales bacterium]|uniref:Uncharacterized protein n=1 Tax=uncultured Thermomicrobiales bacterium TaxID=1645740 RepID=A0A6J4U836_9BACT|nr:MAG: hypothetical protein AVDCRST_MAG59-852 [uncultured Thermomicrobiales bacterium]